MAAHEGLSFETMRAKPSGRGLRSRDGQYEGAMRVLYVDQFDVKDVELISIKLWTNGSWNYRIIDTRDGVTAAEGRGKLDAVAWEMAADMLRVRSYDL